VFRIGKNISEDLALLVEMAAKQQLKTSIDVEACYKDNSPAKLFCM
jgi:hypothetical protein